MSSAPTPSSLSVTPGMIGRFLNARGWQRDPARSDDDVDVYVSDLRDDAGEPLALHAPATMELVDYPHMIDLLVSALASLDGVAPAIVRGELSHTDVPSRA